MQLPKTPWSGDAKHMYTHMCEQPVLIAALSPHSTLPQLISTPGRRNSTLPNLLPASSCCSGSTAGGRRLQSACLAPTSNGACLPGTVWYSASPPDCAMCSCLPASACTCSSAADGLGGFGAEWGEIQVCPGCHLP